MQETHARPHCSICNHEAGAAFERHGYTLYRCPACRFLFVFPQPGETRTLYGEDYFRGAHHGFGYVDYEADKIAMKAFFASVLATLERYRPARGELLDVGAATSFFMKLAESRGWHAKGVEVSAYATARARENGLEVVTGTLESSPWPSASFDAVTMLDVIEHVPDVRGALERARELLRSNGFLFINTPDSGSWWARLFGSRWHAYCPPEHLFYFDRNNLGELLRECGFTVLEAGKIAKRFTPAYVASMLGRWLGLSWFETSAAWLESTVVNRMTLPVNIRDNFFVVAEKRTVH